MRTARFAVCLSMAFSLACGVAAVEGTEDVSAEALSAYRVEVKTPAEGITPGTNAALSIRVLGANDQAVTQFDDLHTQPMHLVAVSSDLKDFVHEHPVLGSDGALSISVPFERAQPYSVFFEYDPKGPAEPQTSRATLVPIGAAAVAPNLAGEPVFTGSAPRSVLVGQTRVELARLAHGMIMPGISTTLRAAVKTSTGEAVTDLVDWLGMPGHAILLSEDASTFIHAHGMRPGEGHGGHGGGHGGHAGHGHEAEASSAPNLLDIDVTFPGAGLYKLFVQVKRGETVVTAPFVLRVSAM